MNLITSRLGTGDILLDEEAPDKEALFEAVGRHMERVHDLPRDSVSAGLGRREMVGSTGLGEGFAIPHCRVRNLDRIRIAYLRLKAPIPFDAPDGKPVSDILVLLVPKEAADEHLKLLAEAAQLFNDKHFRAHLLQCSDPAAVKRLFDDWSHRRP